MTHILLGPLKPILFPVQENFVIYLCYNFLLRKQQSWECKEFFMGLEVFPDGYRSMRRNFSFADWRHKEGRSFLAGIKLRIDFWIGRFLFEFSCVFYLCVSGDLGHGFWSSVLPRQVSLNKWKLCEACIFLIEADLRRRLISRIWFELCIGGGTGLTIYKCFCCKNKSNFILSNYQILNLARFNIIFIV